MVFDKLKSPGFEVFLNWMKLGNLWATYLKSESMHEKIYSKSDSTRERLLMTAVKFFFPRSENQIHHSECYDYEQTSLRVFTKTQEV